MPNFTSHQCRRKTAGIIFTLFLALIAGFSTTGKARAAEPQKSEVKYLLKFGTIAPENTSWGDSAKQTSKEVLEKTHGQVKIVWYFGAVMGDEPDMIRKIRLGQLQGAVFTLAGAGKIAPELRVLSLPFLFNNYEEADYVLNHMAVTIDKILLDKGFINLALVDVGFARAFSNVPLRNENDFARAKAWSWSLGGEPVADETFKLMGAKNLVPVNLNDVLASLQTGLLNVVYGTCYTTVGLQWHAHLKYMSPLQTNFSPGAILVDQKVFETLPSEYQQIVREVSQSSTAPLRKLIRDGEEKACVALRRYGIIVSDLDPDFVKKIRSDAGQLYDKFADIYYPRWLLAGVLNTLQQYRVVTGADKSK